MVALLARSATNSPYLLIVGANIIRPHTGCAVAQKLLSVGHPFWREIGNLPYNTKPPKDFSLGVWIEFMDYKFCKAHSPLLQALQLLNWSSVRFQVQ